jgi:hypothetical protein
MTQTISPALAKCPRCHGELIRNHDELLCMVHGTVHTPSRAWDVPSDGFDADQPVPKGMRRRGPKGFGVTVAWTDEERETWETWREGDPIPGEGEGQMTEPTGVATQALSAEALATACQTRMDEIDRKLVTIGKTQIVLRQEKAKLGKVVGFLTTTGTPRAYEGTAACPECGRDYSAPYGISVHRQKAHGIAGTSKNSR